MRRDGSLVVEDAGTTSDAEAERDASLGADASVAEDAASTDEDAAVIDDDAAIVDEDAAVVDDDAGSETHTLGVDAERLLGPLTVEIDPALPRSIDALPDNDDGSHRITGALAWSNLPPATFVEHELVVLGTVEEIDAVAERWSGTVLDSLDLPAIAPEPALTLARIHIEPPAATVDDFIADHAYAENLSQGVLSVSSSAAFDTLAAAYAEMASGLRVAINPVAEPFDVPSGSTREGSGFPSPEGFTYVPDVFAYPYARRRDGRWTAGTGVAEAVRAMWSAGIRPSADRVRIAVLDGGFALAAMADLTALTYSGLSLVAGATYTNSPNPGSCGGSPCPWHGTGVAHAIFAPWDDSVGAAGSAAGYARPVFMHIVYDWFSTTFAVTNAADVHGARVVNMSFGSFLPAIVAGVFLPFDAALAITRDGSDVSLVAAAGNSGFNVDESAFGIDLLTHWPCESFSVFCVGASSWTSSKRSFSNWASGHESVDVFSPDGQFVVVPENESPTSALQNASQMGTSLASPWVAGILGLLRKANPDLSNNEIESIVRTTARRVTDYRVWRIVDAEAAVNEALRRRGTVIAPPTVSIVSPTTASSLSAPSGVVSLYADFVQPGDTGCCTFHWSSTLPGDASLPSGRNALVRMGPGRRRISVVAENALGLRSAPATLDLTLVNEAPSVDLNVVGALTRGSSLFFDSFVYDYNGPDDVSCDRIFWTTSEDCTADDSRLADGEDGTLRAVTGCNQRFQLWDPSSPLDECATIKIYAIDRYGARSVTRTHTFYPEMSTGPVVTLYSPVVGTVMRTDLTYEFRATASFVEAPLWEWSFTPLTDDGYPTHDRVIFLDAPQRTGVSIASFRDYLDPTLCVREGGQRVWIVARVVGGGGASGSQVASVYVACPPG